MFLGFLPGWLDGAGESPELVVGTFAAALFFTAGSAWYLRGGRADIPVGFLYIQILFDTLLVTAVVHATGGSTSVFAPVYILVISVGALLLPLPGGVLVGFLCSVLYFADAILGYGEAFRAPVFLQMGLFGLVAIVTGWLGDRVRRAGIALGTVETQLRRLRVTTDDILANIKTGILTVDPQGHLLYLNPAGEDLLGLDAAEWQDAVILDAVNAVSPELTKVIRWTADEQRPMARIKAVARRGGQEMTLGISTTVVTSGPEERPSVTAIFQDITDQEHLKVLDRRADRMEAIAELSASLAHEIKNPLASIRSSVEQLTKPALDAADREVLGDLVLRESDRLSRLLSEFLEFSAMKIVQKEDVDFARVVRNCVDLAQQHPEAGDDTRIESAGLDTEVRIAGDEDLLHRAVFNLILNAVQFAGAGGQVEVELDGRREKDAREHGVAEAPVRFSVRDSGPGIDPKQTSRLFDPFFTTREGGNGMGLAVVHRAVEAHHGAVFVERAPQGGAEFIIYLPRTQDGRS